MREAKEIQLEDDFSAPKTIITDPEELAEYRCGGQEAAVWTCRVAEIAIAIEDSKAQQVLRSPHDCHARARRLRKRKAFEDDVRRVGRWNLSIWAKVRKQT